MSSFGPSATDQAAARRQQQQTEDSLTSAIQADTARTTRMRMRTYGLGFAPQPISPPAMAVSTFGNLTPALTGAYRSAFLSGPR